MMERPSINRQLGWGYPQLYSSCFSWINWIETTKHDVSNGGISTKTKVLVKILVEWTSCFSCTKVSNGGISTKHECVFGWIWPSDSCVFLYFLFLWPLIAVGSTKDKGWANKCSNIKKWVLRLFRRIPAILIGWSSHNPTVIRKSKPSMKNWWILPCPYFFAAKECTKIAKSWKITINQPPIFLPRLVVVCKLSFESQQPNFLARPRRFRITHDGSMVLVY